MSGLFGVITVPDRIKICDEAIKDLTNSRPRGSSPVGSNSGDIWSEDVLDVGDTPSPALGLQMTVCSEATVLVNGPD